MTKAEILAKASLKLHQPDLVELERSAELIEDLGYYFRANDGGQWIFDFDGGFFWAEATMTRERMIRAYHQDR